MRSAIVVTSFDLLLPAMECNSDYLELYLDNFLEEEIQTILDLQFNSRPKFIITLRQPKFLSTKKDLSAKKKLIKNFTCPEILFDFDIFKEQELINYYLETREHSSLITSFHHYPGESLTPDYELVFKRMLDYPQCIWKLAVNCENEESLDSLLDVAIKLMKTNQRVIVSPMGNLGQKGRFLAIMLGSYLTYCTLHENYYTAPGQITYKQFNNFLKQIKI